MEKARYLYRVEHPEHGEVQVEAIDRLRAISGAAFYCGEPYTCCAACAKDCNMRCGWLPERKERKPAGQKESVRHD